MTTLLIAEHDKGALSEQTAKALTAAHAMGGAVSKPDVGEAPRP